MQLAALGHEKLQSSSDNEAQDLAQLKAQELADQKAKRLADQKANWLADQKAVEMASDAASKAAQISAQEKAQLVANQLVSENNRQFEIPKTQRAIKEENRAVYEFEKNKATVRLSPNFFSELVECIRDRGFLFADAKRIFWQRYDRTYLGIWWQPAGLIFFVLLVGVLGASLFNRTIASYMPYLLAGVVGWYSFTGILVGSLQLLEHEFGKERKFINSIRPFGIHLIICSIILAQNSLLYFLMTALLGHFYVSSFTFLMALHFGVFFLLSFFLGYSLSVVCLKFRDVRHFVEVTLQGMIFVSPIFWMPEQISPAKALFFVDFNPVAQIIIFIRNPMLGLPTSAWTYSHIITYLFLTVVTFCVLYRRYRAQLPYWK